ncbi:MAG: hypothetical protein H6622_07355 [Halobacteriovoraceae bacterium]|nr:hypothetical protein [Halobacteriovoraceae bacterium]
MKTDLSVGQITVIESKHERIRPFKYHFEELSSNIDVSKTLMSEFEELNLKRKEKELLTRRHRKVLASFKNLSSQTLVMNAKEFSHFLRTLKDDKIVVKADGIGTFICLTAILLGIIPKELEIEFILSETPIKLFPDNLCSNNNQSSSHKITLKIPHNSWIYPFDTLYSGGKKLGLKYFKTVAGH